MEKIEIVDKSPSPRFSEERLRQISPKFRDLFSDLFALPQYESAKESLEKRWDAFCGPSGILELSYSGSGCALVEVTGNSYSISATYISGEKFEDSYEWDLPSFLFDMAHLTSRLIQEESDPEPAITVKDLIVALSRFPGDCRVYSESLQEDGDGNFQNFGYPVRLALRLATEANHIKTRPGTDRSNIVILQ